MKLDKLSNPAWKWKCTENISGSDVSLSVLILEEKFSSIKMMRVQEIGWGKMMALREISAEGYFEQIHKQGENVVCEKLQELLLDYHLGYS